MKITDNGKATKIYYIEVDDKELQILCDAMDEKECEEIEKAGSVSLYLGKTNETLKKVKELAKTLHTAFMGNI